MNFAFCNNLEMVVFEAISTFFQSGIDAEVDILDVFTEGIPVKTGWPGWSWF